jgi:hypothetical protein
LGLFYSHILKTVKELKENLLTWPDLAVLRADADLRLLSGAPPGS